MYFNRRSTCRSCPSSRRLPRFPLNPGRQRPPRTYPHSGAFQTLNAMERQDLQDAIPRFQQTWTTFDPKGSGNLSPKHLFTVRNRQAQLYQIF